MRALVEDRLTMLEIWDPTTWPIPEDSIVFEALPYTREEWAMYNSMKYRKACLPSSNGHFTAHALAKMYDALANGGVVEGVRARHNVYKYHHFWKCIIHILDIF